MISYFIPFLAVVVFILVIFIIRRHYIAKAERIKSAPFNLPAVIPDEGVEVPIYAAGGTLKNTGLLGYSSNNISVKLKLFPDYINYKVTTTSKKNYGNIEQVNVIKIDGAYKGLSFFPRLLTGMPYDEAILLTFNNDIRGLSFYPYSQDITIKLLQFFRQKGVRLSDAANSLVENAK